MKLKTRMDLKKRMPDLLIGLGLSGLVTTPVLAVKATPEAMKRIKKKKKKLKVDKLSTLETIKTAGPCYIPAIGSGVISGGCIIVGRNAYAKENLALSLSAVTGKLAETAFLDYRDTVREQLSPEEERSIYEKSKKKKKKKKNKKSPPQVVILEKGDLFYEPYTHTWFSGDILLIRKGEKAINNAIDQHHYACINDFLEAIDKQCTKLGGALYWESISYDSRDHIEITFRPDNDQFGHSWNEIQYSRDPDFDGKSYE